MIGYYRTDTLGNTKPRRKNPVYGQIFDQLRDLEYTIGEANVIASEAVYYLAQHSDWSIGQAIREALK